MALFGTQAARAAGRGAARRALLSLIGMGALLLTAGAAEAALRAGEAERVSARAAVEPLPDTFEPVAPPLAEPVCGVRLVSGAVIDHADMPENRSLILSVCVEVMFDVSADGRVGNVRILTAPLPEDWRALARQVLDRANFTPDQSSGRPAERRDVIVGLVLAPAFAE